MVKAILYNREDKPTNVNVPVGGVLFETCTRTELYWGDGEIPIETARHLFRVASGLESPLLGEMAIQGQLKNCYYAAKERWKLSAPINRLFQTAIYTGHRVRTETNIAKGAVSYSQVTVDAVCHRIYRRNYLHAVAVFFYDAAQRLSHAEPRPRIVALVGIVNSGFAACERGYCHRPLHITF